ncbi:MAG TPA: aminomethyl-transferring glycine dehydrogenase subunit GcvPB [Candidatus Binatia bacterium]|nr:aminomethyl-transferring glycine dehydrogenase subunit GcvPB [Candidatus Binatia bacterium]
MSEPSRNSPAGAAEPKLIFESGSPGRSALFWPEEEKPEDAIPEAFVRREISGFPELGELETLRHFTRLSQRNFAIESQFYPLGSCTMKYNPKINEVVARFPGFAQAHPLAPDDFLQGALTLLFELEHMLAEISGMEQVSLQPSAGAQGELTGLMLIRACLTERGDPRKKIIVPDTAHGTNPASSTLCGYEVVQVSSNEHGVIDGTAIEAAMDQDVAAVMITNPNTLGLFETNIEAIADAVHARGGMVYLDGANLNALMGIAKPGHMGVDVLHMNLHKTFSTPHGGGGPGAGPVAVQRHLAEYLPVPRVVRTGDRFELSENFEKSIGRVRSFFGNFGVLVRAYAYILSLGGAGLEDVSRMALLNANYIRRKLEKTYQLAYNEPCMHECILTDRLQQKNGVSTLDIAKRLLDYGYHPPTIYFPLVVSGALMIEPTETESVETLDGFIDAMVAIAEEAKNDPELVKTAPHSTPVKRLDEARAARKPVLRWEAPAADGASPRER